MSGISLPLKYKKYVCKDSVLIVYLLHSHIRFVGFHPLMRIFGLPSDYRSVSSSYQPQEPDVPSQSVRHNYEHAEASKNLLLNSAMISEDGLR